MTITGPVEERVDHDAEHHVRGGVVVVDRARIAELVREQRRIPIDLADGRLGVRVEQQLVRVRPLTLGRLVPPVHSIAVALPWLDLGQVAMPHESVDVLQLDARLDSILVEETQLHTLRRLAEQREVRAAAVERRSERVCRSGPGLHARHRASSGTASHHTVRAGSVVVTEEVISEGAEVLPPEVNSLGIWQSRPPGQCRSQAPHGASSHVEFSSHAPSIPWIPFRAPRRTCPSSPSWVLSP